MPGGAAQFLGNTVGEAAAFAAGLAISPLLHPVVQTLQNEAWNLDPTRPIDPNEVAALVAQGAILLGTGANEANLSGISDKRFSELVHLAERAPTYSEAQDLRRRNKITIDQLRHSFAKAQIEDQYWDALADLVDERLSAQVMALAVVRGLVKDPGILPVGPPSAVGKVPAFPVFNIDPVTESAASGFDLERLSILTGIAGRPMGPESAAAATFRKIIEKADFQRAISEGDVRNEWAEAIFETARQIPSVADYINAEIRGWISTAERNDGIARHGMHPADGDLLFKRTGRPATTHQVHIGWARGGRNPDAGSDERAVFEKAIKESDIRPEWADILWAQRYTFPPFFAMRSLMQAGLYDQARWEQILLDVGWPPFLAHDVSTFFTKPSASTAKTDPWVAKAESAWFTQAQKAFVESGVPRSVIEPMMVPLVADLADRDAIFQWWTDNRAVRAGVPPA